jgi:streptomycin 6-kinase
VAGAGLTHGDWLERVPDLLTECAEEWSLRLGEPYQQGAAGYAVRALRKDGAPVVLKLIYPHREAEHEAEALRVWDGDGAVELLAPRRRSMGDAARALRPGHGARTRRIQTPPSTSDRAAAASLVPHRRRVPLTRGRGRVVARGDPGRVGTDGQPFERELLDDAAETLRMLATSQGEQVLLHQDLHTDNVLAARREPGS